MSYYIFWFKVLFHLLHNIEDLLWSFQMEDQEQNGYLLFKKEQANKLKEKGIKVTSIDDHNVVMLMVTCGHADEHLAATPGNLLQCCRGCYHEDAINVVDGQSSIKC